MKKTFNEYMNGYDAALKLPQKAFHEYCMEMRKVAPTEVNEALQTNYRTLLLAVRKQELDDIRKEEEKNRG